MSHLELAKPPGLRVRERPFLVPEQFTFDQRFRYRRAVEWDERALTPRTVVMDGTGDQFFPRPAFPADEHGRSRARDLFNFRVDLFHGRAFADEVMEGVPLDHLGAEIPNLASQLLRLKGLGDDEPEFVHIKRFCHIIGRAQLHGVHGRFDRFRSCEHDDWSAGILCSHGFEQR